jgi:glyoxylase-like metal-dependent hydrolase (beta-lactamase superfamily II)
MNPLSLTVIASTLLSSAALAAPLKVEAFTASPDAFLVTSTLISGEKEAILIDSQFTLSEAHRLAAKVLESKKTLKTIFITHAHPDHWFGLEVLKAQFPQAEILASPPVIDEMRKIGPSKLAQWKPAFGANLTATLVYPSAFKGDHLELEGQRVELVSLAAGESEAATAVWVPSAKTAITGDLAYNGVHAWLAETDGARREAWIKNLAKVKALGPEVVIAGHQTEGVKGTAAVLDESATYIRDFNAALAGSKSAEELEQKVIAKYPTRQLPIIASIAAKAAFPAKK